MSHVFTKIRRRLNLNFSRLNRRTVSFHLANTVFFEITRQHYSRNVEPETYTDAPGRPSFQRQRRRRQRRRHGGYRRVKPQTSRQTKIADKSTPVDDWRSGTYPGGQRRTKCTFISGSGRRTWDRRGAHPVHVQAGVRRRGGVRDDSLRLSLILSVAHCDKLHHSPISIAFVPRRVLLCKCEILPVAFALKVVTFFSHV